MMSSARRRRPEQNNRDEQANEQYWTPPKQRRRRRLKRRKGANGPIRTARSMLFGLLFILSCYCIAKYHPNLEGRRLSEFPSHPSQIEYDFFQNTALKARGTRYEMSKPAGKGYILSTTPDAPDDDICELKRDWQHATYPSCNSLHEIDMTPRIGSFVYVNCGETRCAFKLFANDGSSVALKMRDWEDGSFEEYDFGAARRDGLALERLTASPYLVDIYGYCGLSQVLEYSDGGNLHDLIKIARQKGRDDMSPTDKLRIGIQIASAVSDVHTFEKDKVISLAHNDICCHQYILMDGVYKLNDFHLSSLIKQDKETGEVCMGEINYASLYGLVHSPEENNNEMILQEKSDDYMAGNVMFYVLTKEWLYERFSIDKSYEMLKDGIPPPFPEHITNSTDRADLAMMKAISMLWTYEVEDRPSTREVADFLIRELEEIDGRSYRNEVIRVSSIPPLPKNHRYTDSDYHTNLYKD